ncbi:uncharacterized protein BDW70DRAFT_136039 [Aspergillus foveolatus]|uniref:uncharacterized protein n=1 Tax=Aspergillus foveolatus TaxID=210207 RepID=UPI003CCE0B4D
MQNWESERVDFLSLHHVQVLSHAFLIGLEVRSVASSYYVMGPVIAPAMDIPIDESQGQM